MSFAQKLRDARKDAIQTQEKQKEDNIRHERESALEAGILTKVNTTLSQLSDDDLLKYAEGTDKNSCHLCKADRNVYNYNELMYIKGRLSTILQHHKPEWYQTDLTLVLVNGSHGKNKWGHNDPGMPASVYLEWPKQKK